MPATMMHLAAGKALLPQGSDSFLLGCILPDCLDSCREKKDRVHFRDVPPEKRLEALIRFGQGLDLSCAFDFGVLFHLYLDYLWDNGPQKAHRKSHGEENWFLDYRKELSRAGNRVAQRRNWNKEVWARLEKAEKEEYQGSIEFPEGDIRAFLEFNARWHTTEILPESEIFTDELVDSFLNRACKAFALFLRDFFPKEYAEKKEFLPQTGAL
jgi:hypothetical protein